MSSGHVAFIWLNLEELVYIASFEWLKPKHAIHSLSNSILNMSALPLRNTKVPEKGKVERVGAMTKGFLPTCGLTDFPSEPEEACQNMPGFLAMWFQQGLKKPEGKKALEIATPKLALTDKDTILSRLQLYKQWLQRKKKNLKSGEKTDLAVLHVLKALGAEVGEEKHQPVKGSKPARRLNKKTPEKEAVAEPAKASKPAEGVPEEGKEPATASKPEQGKFQMVFRSPGTPGMESNHGSVVTLSSTSSGCISATALKKPACKRPAAAIGGPAQKKPAMAPKQPGKKAPKSTWVESASFRWIKATKATEKAYIQARDDEASKAYCLVNIGLGRGPQQDAVVEKLMAEAIKFGLTKAQLVELKNSLLRGP